jgi:hypothetical protein
VPINRNDFHFITQKHLNKPTDHHPLPRKIEISKIQFHADNVSNNKFFQRDSNNRKNLGLGATPSLLSLKDEWVLVLKLFEVWILFYVK